MNTAKQEVRKILDTLPQKSTWEDIQYHIYVREKVARGLADVKRGKTLTPQEFDLRFAKWLQK